ncbi:hypothetical protein THAOC_10968 [Thalassiosira oceanica]|uniref:Uncharacterized protein n=1 Tax=Thalassiosira oceanica TaxID=159749 RepID=K0T3F8_THAOC|nr:hypothetical protein THAOC_10968 [Thalassiosira oceanica]|eukprot:EJK67921.1 hypothetical protein THAOC_10968 [Thalassiosira oceanica]
MPIGVAALAEQCSSKKRHPGNIHEAQNDCAVLLHSSSALKNQFNSRNDCECALHRDSEAVIEGRYAGNVHHLVGLRDMKDRRAHEQKSHLVHYTMEPRVGDEFAHGHRVMVPGRPDAEENREETQIAVGVVCIHLLVGEDGLEHFAQIADRGHVEQVEEDVLPLRRLVEPF